VGGFPAGCRRRLRRLHLLSLCFRIHCSQGLGGRDRKRCRRQRRSSHLPRGGVPNRSSPCRVRTCRRRVQ
jgi:hypothetical protein